MAINNCIAQSICDVSLVKDIQDGCDNPMFSGIEQTAVIINKADIKSVSTDPHNHRIVTAINMNPNKRGYFMINARTNPYQGTNTTVEVGDYKNTFTRTVSLFVPMDGAAASQKILDPLANGKFVVILENQFENDLKDNKFQIYGIDKGLVVSSMTQTKYENNDYWVVELQEQGVPNSGRFLIHTEMESYYSTSGTLNATDGIFSGDITVLIDEDDEGTTLSVSVPATDIHPINPQNVSEGYYFTTTIDGVTYRFEDRSGSRPETQFDAMAGSYTKGTDEYICDLIAESEEPQP